MTESGQRAVADAVSINRNKYKLFILLEILFLFVYFLIRVSEKLHGSLH